MLRNGLLAWTASLLLLIFLLLLSSLCAEAAVAPNKPVSCYVDEHEPKDDPNNIYHCNEGQKCCKEEGKPSCCSVKPLNEAASQQVQIWATLGGLILAVALLLFCCRHDGGCCYCCDRREKPPACLACIPCCNPKERRPLEGEPAMQQVITVDDVCEVEGKGQYPSEPAENLEDDLKEDLKKDLKDDLEDQGQNDDEETPEEDPAEESTDDGDDKAEENETDDEVILDSEGERNASSNTNEEGRPETGKSRKSHVQFDLDTLNDI